MLNNSGQIIPALFLLLWSISASAVTGDKAAPTETATRQTEIERSETALSDVIRSQIWGLSETEWRRYRTLMAGIRGNVSPANISPIEVLGIHARSESERKKYAEKWAMIMREDAERILAFQRAYDEAHVRLFPNSSLIHIARLPKPVPDAAVLQATDRVLFFTQPDCTVCDALFERLLRRINQIAGIDIYLSGVEAGKDQAIRLWATARSIKPEWVRDRRITLNFESGILKQITQKPATFPTLLRRRGDIYSQLSVKGI